MAFGGMLTHCLLKGVVRRHLLLCKKHINKQFISPSRHHSYDADGKTTITILNKDLELGLMVDSYSQVGFRLNNGMVVLGPMAIFPRSVLSWNVSGVEEINEHTLSLFCHLEPKIDILVLGVGDAAAKSKWNHEIMSLMNRHHINIEALPTEQACATFNFLNAENRCVAAALIPPNQLQVTDDDVILTKMRMKTLYESDGF